MEALTQDQIRSLEQQLRRDRETALADTQDQLRHAEDVDDESLAKTPHDAGDMSEADRELDTNIAMAERYSAALGDIEDALRRIAEGNYGICTECEQPIGYARLQVQPAAKLCIECQERLEHRPGANAPPTM
jgi:RNA polymerase-binding protein DksA